MSAKQPADRSDKLADAHQRLTDAVTSIVTGEEWQAFLAMADRLHGYSANNVWLIMTQAPWATQVAGYRTWKELGRQLRAGEKGIAILAPCRYRNAGDSDTDQGTAEADTKSDRLVVRGFRVVFVFDINQTDGPAVPTPCRPALLAGEAPAGLWDALAAQITDHGYSLERGHCGGANGRTSFADRLITVRADVDDAQAAKTLAHGLFPAPRARCQVSGRLPHCVPLFQGDRPSLDRRNGSEGSDNMRSVQWIVSIGRPRHHCSDAHGRRRRHSSKRVPTLLGMKASPKRAPMACWARHPVQ